MKKYIISIKNTEHINKITANDGQIKGLIKSLKYHFLKEQQLYIDYNDIPEDARNKVDEIMEEYNFHKKKYISTDVKFLTPSQINNDFRYYFVAQENKIYDFNTDIKIPKDYIYFDWFFAFKILNTQIKEIKIMLDYNLAKTYNNNFNEIKNYLEYNLMNFKYATIPSELRLYNIFYDNTINLFERFNSDYDFYFEAINKWLRNKETKIKNETQKKNNYNLSDILEKLYENEIINYETRWFIFSILNNKKTKQKQNMPRSLSYWNLYAIFSYILNGYFERNDFMKLDTDRKKSKFINKLISTNFNSKKGTPIDTSVISRSVYRAKTKEHYNTGESKYGIYIKEIDLVISKYF